jgi:multicomponent Na+:H+ antiporter subunit D
VTFGAEDVRAATLVADDDTPEEDFHQQLEREGGPRPRPPLLMVLPTTGLVAVSLAFTVLAGPVFGFTDRAAHDLVGRTPYLSAVEEAGR